MELFDQFIQERVYLKGVSPKTVISYHCAFKAFSGATESKQATMQRIMELREKGLNAISINSYLRHVKAYLRWMEQEGHLKDVFKVQFLKTELKVLATLNGEQLRRLLAFRPKGRNEIRAHTVGLLILDGG
jgi:site-specific recombinase XerD